MADAIFGSTDLFGGPALSGLETGAAVISPTEEAALVGRIDETQPTPFRFQGWLGKRLTTSYGIGYDFDAARLEPAAPISDWLMPCRTRAATFAGLKETDLTQALLMRYDPGAGIGWHRDRPYYKNVIGISLAPRQPCVSGDVLPRGSTDLPCRCRRDPFIICRARRGTHGSIASPR